MCVQKFIFEDILKSNFKIWVWLTSVLETLFEVS